MYLFYSLNTNLLFILTRKHFTISRVKASALLRDNLEEMFPVYNVHSVSLAVYYINSLRETDANRLTDEIYEKVVAY